MADSEGTSPTSTVLAPSPFEHASSVDNPPKKSQDGPLITVSSTRFWLLSIGAYIGFFLAMMDASIVSSSLHTMASDFKVFVSVNWIALAYTLSECSCSIVFARVSDIIGRRNAYLLATAIFFVFSLAGGFAQSLNQLIAFRVMQGIGGAGLYSLALILMIEVCPDHLLEYMSAIAGVLVVASGIAGPILGGLLTQYTSWRWIFWINCPICVVSTSFIVIFWPKKGEFLEPPRRSWKIFDYVGSILLIAASILLVFSFQNVGVSTIKDTWSTPIFIAPLVIGILALASLLVWEYAMEHRAAGHHVLPIFPLSLFKNRYYTSGIIATLLAGFPLFIIIFSVPLRGQIVSGKTPLTGSVMLLPFLGGTAGGCLLAAAINARRNFLFESMLVGSILSVIGCALLSTVHGSADDHNLLGYLALAGVGIGATIACATAITGIEVPPRNYAPAQGILSQVRILGGSFGISTFSVLLHNQIIKLIPGSISPQLLSMLGDAQSDFPPQFRDLASIGTSGAFKNGMIACSIISGVCVLLTFVGFRADHLNTKQQRLDMIRADAKEEESRSVGEKPEVRNDDQP